MAAPATDDKIEVVVSDSGAQKLGHSVQEQGISKENSKVVDYYDIMIVGITGQGKSTTADKMVVASNPDKATYSDSSEPNSKRFYVWLVGASPELMDTYLERLACSSHSEKPHLDVNTYYEELVEDGTKPPNTFSCQLISNEATRIRVLDVPGFFGDNTSTPSPSDTRINLCTQEHVTAMRSILRIQSTMRMKFRRILYFLPVRGPLTNRSGILMHDLQLLNQFFGKSVFECMILVATLPTYQKDTPLPENLLKKTQIQFRKALKEILLPFTFEDAIPSPPAIFISMSDDCEKIVEKVKKAEVKRDSLKLSIHQGVCLKCSSLINWIDEERVECIPVGMMEDSAVPIEESFCHPIFLPQGCTLEAFEFNDGVPYVVFSGKNLNETKEICLKCGAPPGTKGCMTIGSKFTVNAKEGKQKNLKVDHTNKIEHHRILDQSKEQDIEKSLEHSIFHNGGGRSFPSSPQQPQHRIIETSSDTIVTSNSSLVQDPGSQGDFPPRGHNTNDSSSSEKENLEHRPVEKHGCDSPVFVAEASEHDPAVKIVHGMTISDEVEGGVRENIRELGQNELSQLKDTKPDDVKG